MCHRSLTQNEEVGKLQRCSCVAKLYIDSACCAHLKPDAQATPNPDAQATPKPDAQATPRPLLLGPKEGISCFFLRLCIVNPQSNHSLPEIVMEVDKQVVPSTSKMISSRVFPHQATAS